MLPPVYALITASSEAAGFLGDRVFRHGDAPQNVTTPYATWFVISGIPENTLDEVPRVDDFNVQVNVWSDDDQEVELVAQAVRDAIEPFHHMTQIKDDLRDQQTMRYGIAMTFTFWTDRS